MFIFTIGVFKSKSLKGEFTEQLQPVIAVRLIRPKAICTGTMRCRAYLQ